ncbi:hypothetical protein A1D23_05215 [Chelonobacter oris]|uniref:helix-turn-helix transcriptional regulator n=1 Tax=Chelonobacter oris TaxID=505317 RepID=UPI00244C0034|nr:hypothetical protein [Chelonobacter oris]MDH2999493.1 hypothetical protein [Chelonobacter oris]
MQTITNEQLFEKLSSVETLLTAQAKQAINESSRELWTVADIADYFRYSERHIRGAIICDPYFPKPVKLPSQRNPKKSSNALRWIAGDVVRYAERKKG